MVQCRMDFVLDPRVFISPPYDPCPKCGKDGLGTLSMGRNQRHRRCRECWFDRVDALTPLTKKVIYIDQFAVSNMMKAIDATAKGHGRAAADPFWLRLFEALERSSKLQLVICPDSDEHERESLMVPYFDALKRMFEQLSHGVSFEASEHIRQRQLYVAVKAWLRGEVPTHDFNPEAVTRGDLHGWLERLIVTVKMTYPPEMVEAIRGERDRIHDSLKSHFERIASGDAVGFEVWLQRELESVPRAMLVAYQQWIERNREVEAGTRPFSLDDIMPTSSVARIDLILRVLEEGGIAADERPRKAAEFLNSEAFHRLPFHLIASSLWAVISMKGNAGQKEPPNRGTVNDISIVSTLMPYCDAMLIDNKCLGLLEDIPKRNALEYTTRMFSTRTGEQFIEYLEALERDSDPVLLAEVEHVYGKTWLTPFLTMYEVDRELEKQREARDDV